MFSSVRFDSNCRHVKRSLVLVSAFIFSGLSGLGSLLTSSTVNGEDHQPSAGEKTSDIKVIWSTWSAAAQKLFPLPRLFPSVVFVERPAVGLWKQHRFLHICCYLSVTPPFCFYFSIWESGTSRQLSVIRRLTSRSSELLTIWSSPSRRRLTIRWSWLEICACEGKNTQLERKNTKNLWGIILKMRFFCLIVSHISKVTISQTIKRKFGDLIKCCIYISENSITESIHQKRLKEDIVKTMKEKMQ